MLPERIVEFVHGPYFMGMGTRDANLAPTVVWLVGGIADADADTVTVFAPDAHAARSLENLADNGQVTVLIGHAEAHETYQIKGVLIETRPTTEHEVAVINLYMRKAEAQWRDEMRELGPKFWRTRPRAPATAVVFRVAQIYDQTPGPNAGAAVDFTPGP